MNKAYFTKSGMDKFLQKLQEDEDRLKGMYNRLAELAEVGGDQYHDNFSYEDQMRSINMLDGELASRKKVLSNCVIVDPPKDKSKVTIGVTVVFERGGKDETWFIAGFGESEPENYMIAYNAPLAQVLMGKQAGEMTEFRGSQIKIKKLT